jgi:Domain of unknown function (DUF6867)
MSSPYADETLLQVVMVTGVIGGGAAAMAGRALAATWRPYWYVVAYMLLLGAGVHFLNFALFHGDILSLPSYLADAAFVVLVASLSFRMTRARQMARQYPWLYQQTGPFSWRERGPQV